MHILAPRASNVISFPVTVVFLFCVELNYLADSQTAESVLFCNNLNIVNKNILGKLLRCNESIPFLAVVLLDVARVLAIGWLDTILPLIRGKLLNALRCKPFDKCLIAYSYCTMSFACFLPPSMCR